MQSSFSLTREEQQKLLSPQEYIRDTLSFRYQDCILCGTRTEFTCIKCGFCYSCHWKKEQVEEIELRNNLKDFYASLSNARNDSTDNNNDDNNNDHEPKSQQTPKDEEQVEHEKWGTIDVLGQPAEPICTYYRCNHKFSAHGLSRYGCRCKHPTNKTLGVFVRYP